MKIAIQSLLVLTSLFFVGLNILMIFYYFFWLSYDFDSLYVIPFITLLTTLIFVTRKLIYITIDVLDEKP